MPIYEYECEKCGRVKEAFQNFSEKPLSACEHCSGKLHKIISQTTFHLKGTGWYVTDYCGKNQKSGSQNKKEDNSSACDSQGSSKTDSQPAKEAV